MILVQESNTYPLSNTSNRDKTIFSLIMSFHLTYPFSTLWKYVQIINLRKHKTPQSYIASYLRLRRLLLKLLGYFPLIDRLFLFWLT